jgi:hypothetical protein
MIASAEIRVIEVSGDIGITQIGDNAFDACVFGLLGSSKFLEIFKKHGTKRGRRISCNLNPLKPNTVAHKNMVQRTV